MRIFKIKNIVLLLALMFLAGSLLIIKDNNAYAAKTSLPLNQLQAFSEVYLKIKQNYVQDISDKELFDNAIKGMLEGLDPHSTFLNEKDLSNFVNYLKLKTQFEPREFKYVAQIGVLTKIDELLGIHKKKSLILPSFKNSLQGYKFKNSSQINISLNEDIKVRMLKKNNLLKVKNLDIVNHFFKKENDVLGKAVADFILSDSNEKVINFKKYFEYLDS